jgi:hypothetical protein
MKNRENRSRGFENHLPNPITEQERLNSLMAREKRYAHHSSDEAWSTAEETAKALEDKHRRTYKSYFPEEIRRSIIIDAVEKAGLGLQHVRGAVQEVGVMRGSDPTKTHLPKDPPLVDVPLIFATMSYVHRNQIEQRQVALQLGDTLLGTLMDRCDMPALQQRPSGLKDSFSGLFGT